MQVVEKKAQAKQKTGTKIFLFWTLFIFIVVLARRVIGPPKAGIDFLFQSILCFGAAALVSAVMLVHFNSKWLMLGISLTWLLTIVLLVF